MKLTNTSQFNVDPAYLKKAAYAGEESCDNPGKMSSVKIFKMET
jgi:hypothetical protein